MIDTPQGKDVGLAGRAMGLLLGGTSALAGLVTLFVSLMNLSVGHTATGMLAGLFTVAFGAYGADRIFRSVHGDAGVDAFRAAVGLVFSVVLFAAIVWNVLLVATGRGEVPGALAIAAGLMLLPLSGAGVWKCGKLIAG